MTAVPVSASYRCKLPQAKFTWVIDRWDRLVLDATWSTGNIQNYRWEIRDYEACLGYSIEWVDPIEFASGDIPIYRTRLPGKRSGKRYFVTLIVYDHQGRKDSVTRQIEIPKRICRVSSKVSISVRFTPEITLTTGERKFLLGLGVIALIIALSGS